MSLAVKILLVLLAVAILAAVAVALVWRWLAMRIARRLAAMTERHLATALDPHLSRAGIAYTGEVSPARRAAYLADIERMAAMMDRLIPLPFGGGIGLDALLGLVPGIGDAISLGLSGFIVVRAAQLGVPSTVISTLIAIQLTDFVIGLVPVIGDIADVAYQADMRSLAVIRAWLATTAASERPRDPRHPG